MGKVRSLIELNSNEQCALVYQKAYLLPGKSVVLEVKFRLYSSKMRMVVIYRIANNTHVIGIHYAMM